MARMLTDDNYGGGDESGTADYSSGGDSGGGAAAGSSLSQASRQSGSGFVTNWGTNVILAATNTPQIVPGIAVPPGCSVHVRATNGKTAGNAKVIFVADYREKFATGNATPLMPGDDVLWPVAKLSQIWVYGTKDDGVVISVVTLAK